MKRFIIGFFTLALGSMLLSASSFAGQDSNSLKQKGMEKTSAPAEEKGFEHKSQYQREQQEGTSTLQAPPEKGQMAQKLSDQYESSPVGFQE